MNTFKPLLLCLSLLAFAGASAYADDAKNKSEKHAKPSMSQTGSAASGASGSASSSGAAARYDFDKADKNKDGRLSREEFNDTMKGGASAGASASGASHTSAGQSATSTAKPHTPASGKMDDKAKTSK